MYMLVVKKEGHPGHCKAPVTLSRFKPRFTTTHPDLRQMVKSGCIGMRLDGKKEIPASMRCLTMLLRCQHDSSTDPLRLMTAALRFTTVEHECYECDASTIRLVAYGSVTTLDCNRTRGGGVWVLSFFLHTLARAQHCSPPPPKKKNRNFKNPQKYLK